MAGKYEPLHRFLIEHGLGPAELDFRQVADMVGGLPPTAYKRPEWWANNDDRHVQARAWLEAGRQVEDVDLAAQRVRFTATD